MTILPPAAVGGIPTPIRPLGNAGTAEWNTQDPQEFYQYINDTMGGGIVQGEFDSVDAEHEVVGERCNNSDQGASEPTWHLLP